MARTLITVEGIDATVRACDARRSRFVVRTVVLWATRLSIGALLVWSGISKIHHSYDFLADVYRYELVGPKLGVAVAILLPWLELAVGTCLLTGAMVGGAFLLATLMGCTFVFANGYAVYRGLEINCGCFGVNGDAVGYATLSRALALMLLAVIGYALSGFHRTSGAGTLTDELDRVPQ